MVEGLQTTFEVLSGSKNRNVSLVLSLAFDSDLPEIRYAAAETILKQRNAKAGRKLVEHWHTLPETIQNLVRENPRQLLPALRMVMLARDDEALETALQIAMQLRDRQLLPDLVRVAEYEDHPLQPMAAEAVLVVVAALMDDARPSEDGKSLVTSCGEPLELAREQMLDCLEKSLKRFGDHHCGQIVEAFLSLCGCQNPLLGQMLKNARDPALQVIMKVLGESENAEVIRGTLTEFVAGRDAPPGIVKVWSHRTDLPFLAAFCNRVGENPSEFIRANLRRMKMIRWMKGSLDYLSELNEFQQVAMVQIARHVGAESTDTFRVIEYLLLKGHGRARREAAEELSEYRTNAADRLVMRMAHDDDPEVKAAIVGQLRDRNIPGAMNCLMEALESDDETVRDAAKSSFPEIEIERFLAAFDSLDPEARSSTGELVKKVDSNTMPRILEEMNSPTRTRRLRALSVIETIELIDDLESQIVAMLQDDDHFVRAEAAALLGRSNSTAARSGLRQALLDSSISVREAAEKSLQQLASLPSPPAAGNGPIASV